MAAPNAKPRPRRNAIGARKDIRTGVTSDLSAEAFQLQWLATRFPFTVETASVIAALAFGGAHAL